MLAQLRPALVSTGFFTVLLGLAYPLAITGIAQVALPAPANGSLVHDAEGQVIGSALIGQGFAKPEYLRPRPSAAGKGYDASSSSGSNLGPLNEDLAKRIATDADALRKEAPGPISADAVTTSASGLDPDISPENAHRQAARIATVRGATVADIEALLTAHTAGRTLGFLGQPRVNVLMTNLALDARYPVRHPRVP